MNQTRSRLTSPIIFSGILLTLIVVLLSANLRLLAGSTEPPQINGVIIPKARELQPFVLHDHTNSVFSNENLLGRWHFIAYGYTDCPDICPTLLSTLNRLDGFISRDNQYTDLDVLFYSIDPQRDTVEKMSKYVPFFNPEFLGLTHRLDMPDTHLSFEHSLGMVSQLSPIEQTGSTASGVKDYSVAHGTMLYLINPKGQLQAIFKPEESDDGRVSFSAEQLYRDYRAVRAHFG